jgi:hypothetical protein
VSTEWFEHLFESGVVRVRTHALLSITCSIERLIERGQQPIRKPLSVVPARQGSNKEPTAGQGDRQLPWEVPMSTMTIHDVRLVPRSTSRPAVRRVERRPSTVRLTRRGRAVVLLAGVLIALVAGVILGAGSVATERPGTPEPTRIVQVGPGDTLWAIAADAAVATGEDDIRTMVDRIERLNALDSGMVLTGQRLRVPTQ